MTQTWNESGKWTPTYNRTDPDEELFTMTLPGPGQLPLPTTVPIQVKIKAKNSQGTSNFSAPIETTCAVPGPVQNLRCTHISENAIRFAWDAPKYAKGYGQQWQLILLTQRRDLGDVNSLDLIDLEENTRYGATIYAYNDNGDGVTTTKQCATTGPEFQAQCNNQGALAITKQQSQIRVWEPQQYLLTPDTLGNSATGNVLVHMVMPDRQYRVTASGGSSTDGVARSLTRVVQCPDLVRAIFDTPNRWPVERGYHFIWEGAHPEADYRTHDLVPLPFLMTGDPRYERSCVLTGTVWNCQEHWAELMKVAVEDTWRDTLMANSIEILEYNGLTEAEKAFVASAGDATIGSIAKGIAWTSDKALKVLIGEAAGDISGYLSLGRMMVDFFTNEDTQFVHMVAPTCLPGIDDWQHRTHTNTYTTQTAGHTINRNYTIHYCLETAE